eukprot:CAMPEP_0196572152 /NCGR_PEP_ID=MMETSP1081-20130531/2243_1 /TAXON_ID=36882 /ORGANISM="Pyramimonas amylifera, Strain CCMP720" /LENGTH=557 /DNA_ID=CAMNT_0041889363 /DNA_START=232 /DNA_END=1905 /DNA_ORIENTATION=-
MAYQTTYNGWCDYDKVELADEEDATPPVKVHQSWRNKGSARAAVNNKVETDDQECIRVDAISSPPTPSPQSGRRKTSEGLIIPALLRNQQQRHKRFDDDDDKQEDEEVAEDKDEEEEEEEEDEEVESMEEEVVAADPEVKEEAPVASTLDAPVWNFIQRSTEVDDIWAETRTDEVAGIKSMWEDIEDYDMLGDNEEEELLGRDDDVLCYNLMDALEDEDVEFGGWRTLKVELGTEWVEGYTGPCLKGNAVTREFVLEMVEHFRGQNTIHGRYAWQIVDTAMELLQEEKTLVDLKVLEGRNITVCGDVHGQFYDLLNIFKINGWPSETNPYVFNGDFVDRGSFSVEVVLTLLAFKCAFPQSMTLIRGNHESQVMNMMYGFHSEAIAKYGMHLAHRFRRLFCHLPLAACLNHKVLVMHGGLFSRDGVTLNDLRAVQRVREPPDEGIMAELLWSDPMAAMGRQPNIRGIGVSFGPDVTQNFLQQNGLSLLVRSHEVKEEGYEVMHGGKLVTIFSAPNYCDRMDNKGALIRFGADMVPNFTSFEAVPHPNAPSYAHPAIFY